MNQSEFWDKKYTEGNTRARYDSIHSCDLQDPVLTAALQHFGDVRGKTVLDIGCGVGVASLFFAHHGAHVLSVDTSEKAVVELNAYCAKNGIQNIRAYHMSAMDINEFTDVDFAVGTMILHHIEPFHQFARTLRACMVKGGKAFFRENNARNKTLMWFRKHVVGRLWVPKYGDADEYPLMPSEVDELRKWFHVEIEYPNLHLLRMISTYLLRGRLNRLFARIDRYLYRYPFIRPYSYRQHIFLTAQTTDDLL